MAAAAMLAVLVCVATMIIKIPSPMKGYLNLGDGVVLFSGWLLGPMYGFLAAGIGSALADFFSGYVVYVPATFIIKGLMAAAACGLFRAMAGRFRVHTAMIASGLCAEIIMVLGYFVFEGFLYGFAPSSVNIVANGIQGLVGLVLGIFLMKMFKRVNGGLFIDSHLWR